MFGSKEKKALKLRIKEIDLEIAELKSEKSDKSLLNISGRREIKDRIEYLKEEKRDIKEKIRML